MESVLLAVPAAFYLGFPLMIKFSQNVDPNPRIETVEPAQWPPAVAQTMSRLEHDLYARGFSIAARYRMVGAVPDTATMITMLVNYKSGDKAMITAIWGCANGAWRLGTHYLEFSTRFEDGHCFDTMNSATLSAFKRGPKDIKTQVPQLQDANELWALHRYVMKKQGAQGSKMVYDLKDVEAYFRRIWRQSFEGQVKFGRYEFNGVRFQPSIKGAYLMAWGMMWPMSWIRRAQMKAKAAAIMREWKAASVSGPSSLDEGRVVVVAESPMPAMAQV